MANRKIKADLEIDGKDNTSAAFRSVALRMGQVEKRIAAFNHTANAFSKTANAYERRVKNIDRAMESAGKRHMAVSRTMEDMAMTAGRYLGPAALAGGLIYATKKSADFQESLTNIQKKAGATAGEMAKMRDEIIDLTHQVPLSVDEISKAFERGAAAGIPNGDLKEFALLSLKVADAWDVTAEEASNAFAGFHAAMGINFGQDMKNYASLINDLADSGISDERDIKDFVDRFGASGVNFGMTPQEVAAYGAAMLNLKMPAEVAARAMNTLTNTLMAPENLSKKAGTAFEKIVGNTKEFAKLSGNDKMVFFLKQLDKLSSQERASALGALLGQGFSDETMRLVAGLPEVLRNLQMAHKETQQASNSVDQVYAKRMDLFNSQIAVLQNNLNSIAVRLGDLGLPYATAGVKAINDQLDEASAQERAVAGMSWDEEDAQRQAYIKRWKELHPSKNILDSIRANARATGAYGRSLVRVGRGEIRDVSYDLDAEQTRQRWMEGYADGRNRASVGRQGYQPSNIGHGYTTRNLPKIGPEIGSRPPSGERAQATGMSLSDQYDEYHKGWKLMHDSQSSSPLPDRGDLTQLLSRLDEAEKSGKSLYRVDATDAAADLKQSADEAGGLLKSGGDNAGASILAAARALIDAANRLSNLNIKVQNASSGGGAVGGMSRPVNADTGKSNTFATMPPGGGGGGF